MKAQKTHNETDQYRIRRDPPAIMSVAEVSIFLGQSQRKTREDVRRGRLPAIKLGGRVLFSHARVLEALGG